MKSQRSMFTTWVYMHVSKDTTLDDSSGVTQVVVLKLVEELEHKGHHLYRDNYYTSPNLFSSLHQVGFGAWVFVGTGGECPQKSAAKLKKGEMTICEVDRYACSQVDGQTTSDHVEYNY